MVQKATENNNIYVVMPAKDEAPRIADVIEKTILQGYSNIIVVNDGSSDATCQIASSYDEVQVLNHAVNLGAGAATQTGIDFALAQGADVIVTIDADQQHFPDDIDRIVQRLEEKNADIVIGSRFLYSKNKIPFIRIIYNKIGNLLTFVFTGMTVSDSQSGMKAFKWIRVLYGVNQTRSSKQCLFGRSTNKG